MAPYDPKKAVTKSWLQIQSDSIWKFMTVIWLPPLILEKMIKAFLKK